MLDRLIVDCDTRGTWHVTREADHRVLSRHGSETHAERAAALHAAETGVQEIVVRDRYHRVRRAAARGPTLH